MWIKENLCLNFFVMTGTSKGGFSIFHEFEFVRLTFFKYIVFNVRDFFFIFFLSASTLLSYIIYAFSLPHFPPSLLYVHFTSSIDANHSQSQTLFPFINFPPFAHDLFQKSYSSFIIYRWAYWVLFFNLHLFILIFLFC